MFVCLWVRDHKNKKYIKRVREGVFKLQVYLSVGYKGKSLENANCIRKKYRLYQFFRDQDDGYNDLG